MSVREKINKNAGVAAGIIGGVVIVAIGVAIYGMTSGSKLAPSDGEKFWFSDDNGATVFADDVMRIPPFDHNGKTAVRAHCYTSDGGKTRFVGYLERFSAIAKKKLEEARASGKPNAGLLDELGPSAQEVKSPGAPDSAWVSQRDSAKYSKVLNVQAPQGASQDLQESLP